MLRVPAAPVGQKWPSGCFVPHRLEGRFAPPGSPGPQKSTKSRSICRSVAGSRLNKFPIQHSKYEAFNSLQPHYEWAILEVMFWAPEKAPSGPPPRNVENGCCGPAGGAREGEFGPPRTPENPETLHVAVRVAVRRRHLVPTRTNLKSRPEPRFRMNLYTRTAHRNTQMLKWPKTQRKTIGTL